VILILIDVTQRGKVQSAWNSCGLVVKGSDGERKKLVRSVTVTCPLPYQPSLALLRCVVAPLRETFFCPSRNPVCHSMGEDFFSHATAQRRNVKKW